MKTHFGSTASKMDGLWTTFPLVEGPGYLIVFLRMAARLMSSPERLCDMSLAL